MPRSPRRSPAADRRAGRAGPAPGRRPKCRRAGLQDRADRRVRQTIAPARATYRARCATWRGYRRGRRYRRQRTQSRPAAARLPRCRSAAPRAAVRAAASRRQSPCSRSHRATSRAVRRPVSASVRGWRGSRDRSPWWCRRLRATAATAAGAFQLAYGRYR